MGKVSFPEELLSHLCIFSINSKPQTINQYLNLNKFSSQTELSQNNWTRPAEKQDIRVDQNIGYKRQWKHNLYNALPEKEKKTSSTFQDWQPVAAWKSMEILQEGSSIKHFGKIESNHSTTYYCQNIVAAGRSRISEALEPRQIYQAHAEY